MSRFACIAVLAFALFCAARADDAPPQAAADNRLGKLLLKPDTAAVVAGNLGLAAQSVDAAHSSSASLVGGVISNALKTHRQAGQILVNVVTAINSLNIAGINLAAGVTNTALSTLVGKIRGEALAIGEIYTSLLGEFGRFVGGSINAIQTLKRGVIPNPLAVGVGALEHSLQSLITFLEAAVSPTVAGPVTAAKFLPHLATLKAVKGLLDALQKAVNGPQGALLNTLDGAAAAANGVLGVAATGGKTDVASLISKALGLMAKIPGL